MAEIEEIVDPQVETPSTEEESYEAFEARMNATEGIAIAAPEITTPAAGDNTPSSEPVEASNEAEAGQIAEASEAADPTEQVTAEEEVADEPEKDTRLSRRMRKLTGTIAELQSRLDALKEDESEEEAPEEVASSPVVVAQPATALKRPKLSDFVDSEEETAFDQYEAAKDAYYDAKSKAEVEAALEKHKGELVKEREENEFRVSKAAADAAWSQAASRWPDFNEALAKPGVEVSKPMEAVLRMDPTSGTELTYYLAGHPEECTALAKETVVIIDPKFVKDSPAWHREGQRLWNLAMARAAMRLGEIKAKIAAPPAPVKKADPPKPGLPKPAPKAAAPPATTPTKKVSTASPPPTVLRSAGNPPAFSPETEEDYEKYEREMNARDGLTARR